MTKQAKALREAKAELERFHVYSGFIHLVLLQMNERVPRWVRFVRYIGSPWVWILSSAILLAWNILCIWVGHVWLDGWVPGLAWGVGTTLLILLYLHETSELLDFPSLSQLISESEQLMANPSQDKFNEIRQHAYEWLYWIDVPARTMFIAADTMIDQVNRMYQ